MSSEKVLKDIPNVQSKLENIQKKTLEDLEFALYGTYSTSKSKRKHILAFPGFAFNVNSQDYETHIELVQESLSIKSLQQLCTLFDIQCANISDANELTKKFIENTMEKFRMINTNQNLSQSRPKSCSRSSKISSFKGFGKKSKLIEIQDEISKLQDSLFLKQEEMVYLEAELNKLKTDEAASKDITAKQSELEQKRKVFKIYEMRLEFKEKSLQKYEDIFQMDSDSSSEATMTSYQDDIRSDISQNRKKQDVQEWTNRITDQDQPCTSDQSSQNQIADLAKSINSMLSRQTVGNQLIPFDGSSCLKWPIFYSQYKLSNETCMFSPKENVLRLNKNLTGEARKTVEMLLVTAQTPDEIINILEMKYGRQELIVDELLVKIHDISNVESLESFMDFSSSVRNIAAVLEGDMTKMINQKSLLANLVTKLPPHLLTQWGSYLLQKEIKSHQESLRDFSNWIQEMSQIVSRITFVSKNSGACFQSNNYSYKEKQMEEKQNSTIFNTNKKTCKNCKGEDHSIENCSQFKSADVHQRWKIVKKNNLCYCCLRSHSGRCRKKKACIVNNCGRFHHNLLHKNVENEARNTARQSEMIAHVSESNNSTLLKIVPIQIIGPNGIFYISALLDEGSTTTLLDSAAAKKIGLSGPVFPLCCKWTGSIHRFDHNSQVVEAEISGRFSTVFYKLKNIRTIDNLNLPEQNYDPLELMNTFPFLEQIAANLTCIEKPCLLIGQNNASLIVSRQIIQPDPLSPILSKTQIGWTIHGNIKTSAEKTSNPPEISFICCDESDEKLHELVKDSMKIESFGITVLKVDRKRTREEERALSIAEKSIRHVKSQFEIKLPWREDGVQFPDSKPMAMQRLVCLEKKLSKNEALAEAYCQEIKKLLEKNYAEIVHHHQIKTERIWYLPHFAVLNPNKPGKVRVVFDAAAKTNGYSLNDFLLVGPDYLKSLFGILLRFRVNKIAFAGDIREMFNRVKISYEDTFSQCFLWRNLNQSTQPKVYRMTAMLFGTSSSPFLAQFVKNYNAQLYSGTNQQAAEAIIENHYVDDYLDSTETVDEAIQLINDVIYVHAKGGFEIRNFISNSIEVMNNIPRNLVTQRRTSELDSKLSEERILGITWNSEKDCFSFKLRFNKVHPKIISGSKIPTKREVLKTAMSVYDPIGLLTPITIKSRILLQHIWRSGIGWDDSITENMFKKWLVWLNELKKSMCLEIPRCYSLDLKYAENVQLHTFVDASEYYAYSSAVYLRMIFQERIQVALVASKARVTPLKTLTIPKLELLAAVMGVRLCTEVNKHLKINVASKIFWSDSRTVLHWLESDKQLPTYVASRVGEILELSEVNEWRWVPTAENVADDCTRDTPKSMISDGDCRWFKGPQFLQKHENDWPVIPQHSNKQRCSEEITYQPEFVHVITMVECLTESLPKIKSHYSWMKLLRISARVGRFLKNLKMGRNNKQTGPLTSEEIEWSRKQWLKEVQRSCFPKDLANIKNGVSNKTGRLQKMALFLDKEDLLRISSRIIQIGEVAEIEKEPILLDGDHLFTKKMILHFHAQYGHQGIQTIINELRRNYWIPHISTMVKKTIRKCVICRRRMAPPVQPKMGLLPQDRLLLYEKPFSSSGIDYFGPFYVKIGRRVEKRYGVLFTCLTVRAIHVEIAHSLNTDSCIMAIRRFLSRRGPVKVIWSDNGSNFHGASRELIEALDDLDINSVIENMTNRNIQWKFIPPAAPFMGGSWERLIGCFKRALTGIMKSRHQTEEVLQTVFAEAEYVVNSRPLTHVSDDAQDLVSICPNNILIGRSTTLTSPGHFTEKDLLLRKQWRTSQCLADMFWKRWLREYIPSLVSRRKWQKNELNIQVGDMVLINETKLPRGVWPIGQIDKIYTGPDGIVRIADIKTANGTLKRAVRKLHRLNVNCTNTEVSTKGENVPES